LSFAPFFLARITNPATGTPASIRHSASAISDAARRRVSVLEESIGDPSIRPAHTHVPFIPPGSHSGAARAYFSEVLNDEPAALACRAHTVAPRSLASRRMRNTEVYET
jgi:hypothetical protein